MELNLDMMRKKINELDKRLVELFEERMETVSKVAEYKRLHHMKVLDSNREQEVIKRAVSCLKNQNLEMVLRFFMEDMMTVSRQYQIHQMLNEADLPADQAESTGHLSMESESNCSICQNGSDGSNPSEQNGYNAGSNNTIGHYGSPGSYSEEAALEHFGEDAAKKAYMTFEEVVSALLSHEIDIGVLPVENSSTGTISAVMDLIRDNPVYITGEHISPICHHLLVIPGTALSDITTVYSHHQGLEQSSKFLKQYPWEQIAYKSTASSAELVKNLGDKTKAAIASKRCAKIYGLETLVSDIHYNKNNYTRFITVEREPVVDRGCNKISIVMDIAHKPGALYNILRLFNERNLNLLKIESRPIIGKQWEYLFFFDFEGNLDDPRVKELLECLKDAAHEFRILGNYRAFNKFTGCR